MKPKIRKAPKGATFENAMRWLRRGHAIRRRAWHVASHIFRTGQDVFVRLPGHEPSTGLLGVYKRAPDIWRPYPEDFLATDWTIAR